MNDAKQNKSLMLSASKYQFLLNCNYSNHKNLKYVFNPLHTFLFYLSIFHSSFRKYLDCSEFVTRRTCGMETGLFIRDFIHRMSDTLMRNYCEEYYKGSNHCSNEFSSASLENSSSAILFTFVGISVAIQRNS